MILPRIAEQIEWLSLIDISGPFLAGKVLEETFPQGLDKIETPRRQRLRAAYDEWRDAVDENDPELKELHDIWTRMVLREALEYEEQVLIAQSDLDGQLVYLVPEHGLEEKPDFAVRTDDGVYRLLVSLYPPKTDLDKPVKGDRWVASPAERMTAICRASDVRIGLITNGEQWMLVNAPIGNTSGYASWFARIWAQEPVTLKAFASLLGVRRCFGPEEGRLDQLLEKSLAFQDEVTDTLGEQVRRAVEVLVQSLGRADQDRNGELLKDVRPEELYEAGLTVMMRLVFILCAEERDLLLLGDPIYDQHYAISTLRAHLREDADQYGVEVLERRHDAWSRILSIFRMVFGGVDHEALRMPALGGSLFDPDRFPFLEGRSAGSSWRDELATPLPIDNRTVLLLMNALQILECKGGAQLLSYRALDVEQIGHVYEGLLEYTVARLPEPTIALIGSKKVRRPTITISELERIATETSDIAAKTLAELTGRSTSAVKKALAGGGDLVELIQACGGDEELAGRLLPFSPLIQTDSWGTLLVYRDGAFAIVPGTDRRETGTHYTPRSLTETIVEKTLEPIVYAGPAKGLSREEWKLKTPAELLDLKICDPAMGSGAFLVEVCRYLSQRLVETWQREEDAGRQVTVEGEVVEEIEDREPLPKGLDDRLILARRLITDRCLYGVDKNPLAVELAKLSIWLVTLSKNRPFAFLDHALRSGDSLVGLSDIRQLEQFALKEEDSLSVTSPLFGNMTQIISNVISAARMQRTQLERRSSNTVEDIDIKQTMFANVQRQTIRLKYLADVIIAAYWESGRQNQIQSRLQVAFHDHIDRFRDGSPEDQAAIARSVRMKAGCPNTFHWPVEFPEVFQRENGGFDAIVGNPPFVPITRIDPDVRRYIEDQYTCAVGRHNTFSSFAERTLIVTTSEGSIGLVVPDRLFLNVQYEPLRTLLFDALAFSDIIDFSGAFNATVDTIAIVGHKARTTEIIHVVHRDENTGQLREKEFIQSTFRTAFDGAINIYVEAEDSHVYGSVKANSIPLGEIANVKDGIIQGAVADLLFIDKPIDSSSRPLLFGEDICRYRLTWSGRYVNYKPDELMEIEVERRGPGVRPGLWMRNPEIFGKPKILTRQTADHLIGVIDTESHYYANTLHGTSLNDDGRKRGYSLELILAILNSRLMKYIYAILTGEVGKVFAQIKIDTLKKLPMWNQPDNATAKRLVSLVGEAVGSLPDQRVISEIDELVFDLYGLSGSDIQYVQQRTMELFGE